MSSNYSGNFRVMDAGGMTQSCIGVRYEEDGSPISGVIFGVNTASKLETYHSNALRLLPKDWESWSQSNLPPTGLLCVHTEDYGLGEADNVLAAAERLRGKVLAEMRGGNSVEQPVDEPATNTNQQGDAPAYQEADLNRDGVVSEREQRKYDKGRR